MKTVHVVSFPKSGRTWVEVMVNRITASLAGLDLGSLLRGEVGVADGGRPDLPRVVFGHGHDNGRLCRDSIFAAGHYRGAHVALLVRDPRDVLVSHYYAARYHYHAFDGSLEDFIDHDARGEPTDSLGCRFGLTPIVNYLNGWAANAGRLERFEVFHYEDFKRAPGVELARLCMYLGLPASADDIERAVEFGSVENMRAIEAGGGFGWHALAGSDDPRGKKVRRATVGGNREELGADTLDRVNDFIEKRLHPMFDRYRRAGLDAGRTASSQFESHTEVST
jgi:hypothetical protein